MPGDCHAIEREREREREREKGSMTTMRAASILTEVSRAAALALSLAWPLWTRWRADYRPRSSVLNQVDISLARSPPHADLSKQISRSVAEQLGST